MNLHFWRHFFESVSSSNVNEIIRAILNFFYFFTKRFYARKKHKMHKRKQKGKKAAFYTLKKHLYFFLQKFLHTQKAQNAYKRSKRKKTAFCTLKNHLRERKSLIRLFAFCAFYAFCVLLLGCVFVLFMLFVPLVLWWFLCM